MLWREHRRVDGMKPFMALLARTDGSVGAALTAQIHEKWDGNSRQVKWGRSLTKGTACIQSDLGPRIASKTLEISRF